MNDISVSRELLQQVLKAMDIDCSDLVRHFLAVELRAILEAPAPTGPSGDKLSDFSDDQWWLPELDAAVENGTHDQKRAVAVVRNLLYTIHAHLTAQPHKAVVKLSDSEIANVLGFTEYTTEPTQMVMCAVARAAEEAVLTKNGWTK